MRHNSVETPDAGRRTPDSSRIAVTGLGIVSPIGIGHERFWSGLCAGMSGIRAVPGATDVPRIAAQLVDFLPREFITSAHLRRMDTVSRTIVSACRMALTDAQLGAAAAASPRVGVVVGSMLGNVGESVHYLERLFTKGPSLASPMTFPNLVLNAAAGYAAMEIGCTGANLTVSHLEISGEQALAVGCDLIRSGRADVVVAGGGDERAEIVTATHRAYRALSSQRGGPEWCSPYDAARNGIVLGEGAAMLVLESLPQARRRGVRVYAEIEDHTSFGVPAPTYDWPAHAPTAAVQLRQWLARTLPADASIDVVLGNANSSLRLDACALDILARLFGESAARIAVTSIKGAIGEFGAAGALTAVAGCLALHHQTVPPLCHLCQPLSPVPFQFVQQTARAKRVQRALLLSMARGGATIALLLRQAQQ